MSGATLQGQAISYKGICQRVQEVGALETTRETEAAALVKWDHEQSTRLRPSGGAL
jgi:hypothetical protein